MTSSQRLNWEDVRVFEALTRSSSLREAAGLLGLTHPTVRRRLDALEASVGFSLFHRGASGLQLTTQGQEMADAATGVHQAMDALSRRARAVDPELKGPVRVSMASELARVLTPAMARFVALWPQCPVVVDTGTDFVNLATTSVDIAVRVLQKGRQPEGHLTGRKAASGCNAVYGHLESGRWLGVHPGTSQTGWTATSEFDHLPVHSVIPDAIVRREACRQGMGIAMLPCMMGDRVLPRLTEPNPAFDVWVLVHPDLRHNPRLRLFRDAMVEALAAMEGVLQGTGEL